MVEGVAVGEPATFDEWVAERGAALLRTAYLLTGDVGRAEDAVQESLVRVYGRWPRLVAKGNPEPYVRRTLYSACIDGYRRRDRGRSTSDPPEPAPSADHATTADARVVLRAALAQLTERQRAVLVLRFYEDLTEAQAAELLGCSVSTVKSQTRHALQRLRELAPQALAAFRPDHEVRP